MPQLETTKVASEELEHPPKSREYGLAHGDLRGHLEHGRRRRAHHLGLHRRGRRQQPADARALAGRRDRRSLRRPDGGRALPPPCPESGGDYIYLYEAYGPPVAFLSGWVSFLIGFAAPIAASAFASASYLLAPLGLHGSDRPGSPTRGSRPWPSSPSP